MIDEARDNLAQLAQALRPALSLGTEGGQSVISSELAKYAVHRHRVGPLLHLASKQQVDVNIEDGARSLLEASFKRNAISQLRQQSVESTLANVLSSQGISFNFIKGRGLSQQLYGDQPVRVAKDIDMLVEQSEFRAAFDALIDQGFLYRPLSLNKREWATRFKQRFDARIFKDVTLFDPSQSVSIELHRRLLRFEPDRFTEHFLSAAGLNNTPQITDAFYCLYLILHGSKSFWHRLKWVADFSMLARKMDDLQVRNVMCLSSRFGCANAVVASALLLREVFPGSLSECWTATLGNYGANARTIELLGHFRRTITSSDIKPTGLPFKSFLSSGTADLIFPGQIAFVPSALNRLLGSLSIRF